MSAEIGIKTADGRIVELREQAVFTTVVDRQRVATFALFQRSSSLSAWTPLQTLSLGPLPPAPAGKPTLTARVLKPRLARDPLSLQITDSFTGRSQTLALTTAAATAAKLSGPRALTPAGAPAPAPALVAAAPVRAGAQPRRGRKAWLVSAAAVLIAASAVAAWQLAGGGLRPRPAAPAAVPRAATAPAPAQSPATPPPPAAAAAGAAAAAAGAAAAAAGAAAAAPPPPAVNPLSPPPRPDAVYRVVWGDTLWQIAEKFYGDRSLYNDLAAENRLRDADVIIAGETLRLPEKLKP